MDTVPTWRVVHSDGIPKLEWAFTALNFQAAMQFLILAGEIAESRNHHPDLHITNYRNVVVSVYSHGLSGITENDFNLCRALAAVPIKYSPKFLKDSPSLLNKP